MFIGAFSVNIFDPLSLNSMPEKKLSAWDTVNMNFSTELMLRPKI